jgi:hypothetical protein
MPAISLVVCVYQQGLLLQRLLQESEGCYDDLVVVHDGSDISDVAQIARRFDARFFQADRIGSLEGQSPFAWRQANHDWILRLDADEFPSEQMKQWLRRFRRQTEPAPRISGYSSIWPLWNGKRAITNKWPAGRIFLFNKNRVRFFGMVEQVPIPDGNYEALDMILHHQPQRRSHGLRNVLFRRQAYHWRSVIAQSLMKAPTDLPCWRWDSPDWPSRWEEIRTRPVRTLFSRLIIEMLRTLRDQWRAERRIFPSAAINGSVHHALICLEYLRIRRLQKNERGKKQTASRSE